MIQEIVDTVNRWSRRWRLSEEQAMRAVAETNGTYFSVTPFAILRFISARGLVSQP